MLTALLAFVATLFPQTPGTPPSPKVLEAARLVGTWEGRIEDPEDGPMPVRFALWPEPGSESAFEGGLRAGEDTSFVEAVVDLEAGRLRMELTGPDGTFTAWLAPDDSGWNGRLSYDERTSVDFSAARTTSEIPGDLRLEVDLTVERPVTIDRRGLPDFLEAEVHAALVDWAASERAVGVSVAYIYGFEIIDVRSIGWEDFARRRKADRDTRYRWASISKTLTAVSALQLVERDELDLEKDVRDYVPEFPEKKWKVTARDLLCHQGGIVHYQHGPIRTRRTYDDPNPFRDSILALDMFKESPLLHEPGSSYSYSTHGFALLGAVVERAGSRAFREQVRARIVEPLGLTTLRPDFHQSEEIPDQTVGYVTLRTGRTIDSGDSNVAWKLAGGGFLSSVEDLARFGLALMADELLEPETREEMCTPKKTASGGVTGYGFGVQVGRLEGYDTIGHGGSQRKTRTFLRLVPSEGMGVAVMCNTEGTDTEALADRSLKLMLD